MSVSIEVTEGHFALVAESLGTHDFAVIPRKGDLVTLDGVIFEVDSLLHRPLSSITAEQAPVKMRCVKVI